MTAAEYIAAGYELSKNVEQTIIDKAEKDVKECYIYPILGDDADLTNFKAEVMGLAFCLMLRRQANKTRYGVEVKSNPYGIQANSDNLMKEISGIALPIINKLKKNSTIDKPKIKDIIDCGYYIF
jgi:hypothetical protein